MDVPGHFVANGRRSPQITPRELVVPIVVIDISNRVASNPDAVVTPNDLRAFERRHGRIPVGVRREVVDEAWLRPNALEPRADPG
jgi:kynurenine formamidase